MIAKAAAGFVHAEPNAAAFPKSFCALAVTACLIVVGVPASAEDNQATNANARAALAGEVAHAQRMRLLFPDPDRGAQGTPPVIPGFEIDGDPTGAIATFRAGGPTITAESPFFQSLGSNSRTCFTCHQPADGWSLSARHAQNRFNAHPDEPLFRLVDGATCPSDDVSTPTAKQNAYKLLLEKGLIRIGLPMPPQGLEFEVIGINDPYGCNTNPTTGLTGPRVGTISVYRRPLPSTNLGFLSTIMWDGREPDLFSQAVDATLGHAQAGAPPSAAQQRDIVAFEGCPAADTPAACAGIPPSSGLFTAQLFDKRALWLNDSAVGGPVNLLQELKNFFIGVNDPLGNNPTGAPFTPEVFDMYEAWGGPKGVSPTPAARAAIARGEQLFNTVPINITGVAGLNDALNQPTIAGFCGTCHDTPAAGNHSVKAPLDIGVADAGSKSPPVLDIAGLPVFTLWCTQGPLAGQILAVTDPGRALITGKCEDIGKVKGPILRGLAARAPYFHNGSAATLRDVVDFYDQRFNIGLTEDQKTDLVAFLKAL
jgi:cytochrome c peroxidase